MSTTQTEAWSIDARKALIEAVALCLPGWTMGNTEVYAPIVADRILRDAGEVPVLIWAVDRIAFIDPVRGMFRPEDVEAGAGVKVYTVENVYRMLKHLSQVLHARLHEIPK